MANELKNAVAQILIHAAAITGVRGSSHGQPRSIPMTPWVAVFASGGDSGPYTFGTTEDTHRITVRFYFTLTSSEDTEDNLEDLWELAADKFWGDIGLTGKATFLEMTGYTTGYQDVGRDTYRILDVILEVQIAGAAITI